MNRLNNIDLNKLPKCYQAYDKMPMINGCKTCMQCDKVIHDFRKKTLYEISIIHANSEESVCGIYSEYHIRPKKSSRIKSALNIIHLSIMGLITNPSYTQKNIPSSSTQIIENANSETKIHSSKNDSISNQKIVYFQGFVLDDETQKSVLGATVLIQNTTIGTSTGLDGGFKLQIENIDKLPDTIIFIIQGISFGVKTIEIPKNLINRNQYPIFNYYLKEMKITSFTVYNPPWYKKLWHNFLNIFR